MTRSMEKGGCALNICPEVVIKLYKLIFNDLFSRIERFWSFLKDIGPFLRPNLGGKLGDGYQIQTYKTKGS